MMADKKTGYIKINRFAETTYDEFVTHLKNLKSAGMQQLMIDHELFYWSKPNSQAEIDFVFQKEDKVIPVEIKSGTTGTLKSMMQFLNEKPATPYGVHISPNNFGKYNNIKQIPLCAIWKMF